MFAIVTKLFLIAVFFYRSTASNVNDRYYPTYHLAPPHGWMNDPNGFCVFNNEYHLFYQYNPKTSAEPGVAHWGHAKSTDLFHWKHLDIAMYPDQEYDKTGVFSGSALIENNKMYLFYTGNVNHAGETPDHIQRQALAYSSDGENVTKYSENPIIMGEEHQPNIRDPKVWKHLDTYYMVLGNSFNNNTLGRVLLYSSTDMISWEQKSVLDESNGDLGYMWECPDFFELGKKWILLFSPQGVQAQGDNFKNLYQTGYTVGDFDYETNLYTPKTKFVELDHGHDFYATQSILDASGRRIVTAWFDMWEQVYPERDDGWTGQMTIPRVLELTHDYKLLQKPVEEIAGIRGDILYSGKASAGTSVKLVDNAGEIRVKAPKRKDFELTLTAGNTTVSITYSYLKGTITLDRGGDDGVRRTKWRPCHDLKMQLFVDCSSVELFCGEGEVTFSSRFFGDGDMHVALGANSKAHEMTVYRIKRSVPAP